MAMYTAQYKVLDIYKTRPTEAICGKSKEKIRKDIVANATEEQPIVWAIFDSCGVCVNGGVARPGRGNSTIWKEEDRDRLAHTLFNTKKQK